ncbi:gastrula zinc finger protein XlCGF57.1 [Acyrthosiphon pisum]|uniref:C2H2-type domain-containing protein n=1 Tax=Acyrthosiphon pisum TaxID=7029 RepID=A0A8R1W258_ACYPI|nr:gastrula zinc finger protein XlCGF57.1 [Acyrthosiphon pisum]|eukprot:XP_001948732.2 PREDICTED: gastrula zinc finger protein XlCGF57.1 [Acyrthosiphon pisum]
MYVEMISDLLDLFNKLLNFMTEVGVLDSFTFMHSAINLNSQHEQFLKRIQSSIDELKKWLQNVCTEWKAEDLASLGNVIEPPMTPNNIDLNMNGTDYITPLIKEKIDSVLGFRNPVSPILWSVGLRPIQESNSKDGFEIDDDQRLPTDFVAPSFGDYGSPSSEPWNVFQESNYDLDQTNMDEKGPQTPNIKLYRKEEEPDIIQDMSSNSSCFPHEINRIENLFPCQKCKHQLGSFEELEEHLKTHQLKSKFTNLHLTCAYCNKSFYKKSNLRLHMLIHENIKPYACLYCDRQFTQKATRDIHLTKHTGDYLYLCYVCNKKYATKGKLEFHMKTHQEAQYECTLCSKRFSTQQYLNYHMKVHPDQNTSGFNCDVCQTEFKKKRSFLAHRKQEHPFCMFKCPTFECDKEFSTIQLLNRHIKRLHEAKEKSVICSECGKSFDFPNYLQKHIVRVHGPKRLPKFKCRQCPLRFDNDVMLHVHMQSHPKDNKKKEIKRVSCPRDSCNLSFYNRVSLRYHIAEKHDNIYRYECEICQKKFVRKNHYELHKAIHLKPNFTCNMCFKRFRKKNRLAAHWKRTHQQETFDFGMLFSVDTIHKLNL